MGIGSSTSPPNDKKTNSSGTNSSGNNAKAKANANANAAKRNPASGGRKKNNKKTKK